MMTIGDNNYNNNDNNMHGAFTSASATTDQRKRRSKGLRFAASATSAAAVAYSAVALLIASSAPTADALMAVSHSSHHPFFNPFLGGQSMHHAMVLNHFDPFDLFTQHHLQRQRQRQERQERARQTFSEMSAVMDALFDRVVTAGTTTTDKNKNNEATAAAGDSAAATKDQDQVAAPAGASAAPIACKEVAPRARLIDIENTPRGVVEIEMPGVPQGAASVEVEPIAADGSWSRGARLQVRGEDAPSADGDQRRGRGAAAAVRAVPLAGQT